jgi:hypothetical protein
MFNSFHSFRRVKGLETWVCLYHLLSICLRRRKGTRWIGWNSGHCSPYFHHLRLAEPFAAGSFRLVKCLAFDYEVSHSLVVRRTWDGAGGSCYNVSRVKYLQ